MKTFVKRRGVLVGAHFLIAALFSLPITANSEVHPVSHGKKLKTTGVITERLDNQLVVRGKSGRQYAVVLTGETRIEEKTSNFLRERTVFSADDLKLGLQVRVVGWGDENGKLVAARVRFTKDELTIAETISARVEPVEGELDRASGRINSLESRLEGSDQRVARLSDNLDDVEGSLKIAHSRATAAGEKADSAQRSADLALSGVQAAQDRISSLDDYEALRVCSVQFKFNSHDLSDEARTSLDELTGAAKSQDGFVLEVIGYASSDGDPVYNRRLSALRAQAVQQYLAEQGRIPLRRFVTPYGFGENQPLADNSTLEGRQLNRRVEVRLLVNSGLADRSSE